MAEIIRVKKKDVRKILNLYTLEGLTQKEIASIVFGKEDIKGVTANTLVQRVLHYLGVNMEHRKDYKHDGLTPQIIDLILDNRTIAFPLAIPVNDSINPAIIFNEEVDNYLRSGKKMIISAKLKNAIVLAMLVVLTYLGMISANTSSTKIIEVIICLALVGIPTFIEGYNGRGLENSLNTKTKK